VMLYLPYAGMFLGILIAFEALRQVVAQGENAEIARRARVQKLLGKAEAVPLLTAQRRAGGWRTRIPVYGGLEPKMRQAGMTMKLGHFIGLCALAGAVSFALSARFVPLGVGLAVAFVLGFGLPVAIVNHYRRRRIEAFTAQLPDALDLMMRGLRVGHPINATIYSVVANMKAPIASEFAILSNQIEYGDDITSSFMALAERVDQEDMYYLAASIGIQHGTGGNLAGMLGTLAKVIRGRGTMRRRVRAISSEGRLSALILSALPLLILAITRFTAPNYYTAVQDDPLFLPMAIAVVVLLVANFLTLRKLASFRI
jgi:tight adherence protein B